MEERVLDSASIKSFAAALKRDERASATVEKYLRDVSAFAAWLGGREVTREAAAGWKTRLLEDGLTPTTVNAKLSAVNGLFKCMGWDECRVKFLKVQKRTFRESERELSRTEYDKLVEAAKRRDREWLALAMEVLCGAGLRVSELKYITVEAARSGRTDIALKGKIRTILLPGKLARKLQKYARKQKIATGAIFRAGDGKPMSRFRIWRSMKSLCAEAGVRASKVFPHNLRRLFAVTFYGQTRDVVGLADILGHSSVNTTRIYLMTTGSEHALKLDRLGLVR